MALATLSALPAPVLSIPYNLEAEQAVLGAILVDNRAYEAVAEFLLDAHFYDPLHGRLYAALLRLIERGQLANPITLKPLVEGDEALKAAGGVQYLLNLASNAASLSTTKDYGLVIYDLHLRRELVAVGDAVQHEAKNPASTFSGGQQIELAEKKLFDLATEGVQEKSYVPFRMAALQAVQSAEAAYKRDNKFTGVATGLNDLDRLLGGLHPSDLIIIAGRPSMGKTSLATNMAHYAAKHVRFKTNADGRQQVVEGAVAAFFSLEMSAEQLAVRILADQGGISSEKIRRGDMDANEFNRLLEASQQLTNLPLFIDDTPGISVTALRTRARRLKRQHQLGLIVVDYLQLMRPSPGQRQENRVQELSEITRGLKAIAKELHVPVIALSQLSRAVEARDDKRPQLADLRESGSIEQDADMVMFVYREEYYLARQEPDPKDQLKYDAWFKQLQEAQNIAELIIAKQRHGPIGKVRVFFDGATTRFSDLAASGQFS
jgi:replicative DNA helicase